MAHELSCDVPGCTERRVIPSGGRVHPLGWLVLDDITICPNHRRIAVVVDDAETAVHVKPAVHSGNGGGRWVRPGQVEVAKLAATIRDALEPR